MRRVLVVLLLLFVVSIAWAQQFCPSSIHPLAPAGSAGLNQCQVVFSIASSECGGQMSVCDTGTHHWGYKRDSDGHVFDYYDVMLIHAASPSAPYYEFRYNQNRSTTKLLGYYVNGVFNYGNWPQYNTYAQYKP